MSRYLSIVLTAVLLTACVGDESSSATGDAGAPDAERLCAVSADYGDVGTVPPALSVAVRRNDPVGEAISVTYIGALDGYADKFRDQIVLQLYRGYGVFTSNTIQAGTYPLVGDELNYSTCGVCVRVFADRPVEGGPPLQDMMATGGTVTVTEVDGAFRATLTDAAFEHVHIDAASFESTPVGDGCETAIRSLVADVPMSVIQ